jgi:hypothetical protein
VKYSPSRLCNGGFAAAQCVEASPQWRMALKSKFVEAQPRRRTSELKRTVSQRLTALGGGKAAVIMLLVTACSLLIASARALALPQNSTAASKASTLHSIDGYTKQLERFRKRTKPRRVFANVGSDNDDWREIKEKPAKGEHGPEDYYETAYVWTKQNKVVAVVFNLTDASGDWGHFLTYYFRDDGTLAKVHSRLNTFYGDVTRIREQYYGRNGKLLQTTNHYFDIKTQKPKKNPNFHDQTVPIYLTVRKLPLKTL